MVYFILSRSKIKAYACGISKRHEMYQKTVTIRRNYMCAYLFSVRSTSIDIFFQFSRQVLVKM